MMTTEYRMQNDELIRHTVRSDGDQRALHPAPCVLHERGL